MPDAWAFILFDGHLHGNESKLVKGFSDDNNKALPKEKKVLFLTTTEASQAKHKSLIRGTASLSQVEMLHVVTKSTLDLPAEDRLRWPGTTRGNMLGPAVVPTDDTVWKVLHAEKKKLYGGARVECGGAVQGDTGADRDEAPKAKDLVPFSYHTRSEKIYEELVHSFSAIGVVDLTCSDGVLATTCIRLHKPYFGVAFSEEHKIAVQEYIVNEIFKAFQKEQDPLAQQELIDYIAAHFPKQEEKAKRKASANTGAAAAGGTDGSGIAGTPEPSAKKARGATATAKKAVRPKAAAGPNAAAAGAAGNPHKAALLAKLKELDETACQDDDVADDEDEGTDAA